MNDLTKLTEEAKEAQKLQERTDYMLNAALKQVKQYKERLENCEETLRKSRRIEKEGIAAIASAAATEKRLAKCEAALKDIRTKAQAIAFMLPVVTDMDGTRVCNVDQLFEAKHAAAAIVDAARAALEEK